jgi:hypothetical protein
MQRFGALVECKPITSSDDLRRSPRTNDNIEECSKEKNHFVLPKYPSLHTNLLFVECETESLASFSKQVSHIIFVTYCRYVKRKDSFGANPC